MSGRRSALVVGIDAYSASAPVMPLNSCVADAEAVKAQLARHFDDRKNFDVATLLGRDPVNFEVTRQAFRQELANALDQARDHDFVLYFSGHGDDHPQFGPAVITQEGDRVAMDEILTLLNSASFTQATVMLDTCFAGNMGQLASLRGRTFLREGISILAASRSDQSALAGVGLSAFTEVLVDGLDGGAADLRGHVTASALFDYTSQSFTATQQAPVFRASIAIGDPLREAEPPVELQTLQRLKQMFKAPADTYVLEESDVPTGAGANARQQRYIALRKLRYAGLVTCIDDMDLRELAQQGGEVSLTARGRYALRLVANDVI